MNKAIIIGRLGNAPESKVVGDNDTVTNLSIATSEKYKDKSTGEMVEKTEWHRVFAWGRTAEIMRDYLNKGDMVAIEGKIETESYEKDGVKMYATKIQCYNLHLLDNRGKSDPATERAKEEVKGAEDIDFGTPPDDDGLPF